MQEENKKPKDKTVIGGYFGENSKHPANNQDELNAEKTEYKTLSEKEIMDLCPPKYDESRREVWLEIASDVNNAGHLITKNMLRIKQIVPIICTFRECFDDIDDEGLVYETEGRNGVQRKANPLLPSITGLNTQITSFCTAFGLDPASEARLKDPRQGDLGASEGW